MVTGQSWGCNNDSYNFPAILFGQSDFYYSAFMDIGDSHHQLLTDTHNIENANTEFLKSKKLKKKLISWGSRGCSSLYGSFWRWNSWLYQKKPEGKFFKRRKCNVIDIIESNCEHILCFGINIDERIGVPYKYDMYLLFFRLILLIHNFHFSFYVAT